jgi:hypothetical protein
MKFFCGGLATLAQIFECSSPGLDRAIWCPMNSFEDLGSLYL